MGDHYFSANPAGPSHERTLRVTLAERDVEVVTTSGIFSPGYVDTGTRVLLDGIPEPPRGGDFLDLGCGWGPIALSMAMLSPNARVWAVDVNERALEVTSRNAERLGLANVRAVLPEDVPAEVTFRTIWSNPPIRVGKAMLHTLIEQWIPRLAPMSDAYLVVQRNLGADSLHRWMTDNLGDTFAVHRFTSAKGFRVLRVRHRSADTGAFDAIGD